MHAIQMCCFYFEKYDVFVIHVCLLLLKKEKLILNAAFQQDLDC